MRLSPELAYIKLCLKRDKTIEVIMTPQLALELVMLCPDYSFSENAWFYAFLYYSNEITKEEHTIHIHEKTMQIIPGVYNLMGFICSGLKTKPMKLTCDHNWLLKILEAAKKSK